MVTTKALPDVAVLPEAKSKLLYGFDPLILTREDMTNFYAWYQLAHDHYQFLEEKDFIDKDNFMRYFLISTGLLEYAVAIVSGAPGAGKSLVMGYLTHKIAKLFNKRVVLDWTPPNPELYGDFHNLYSEEFIDNIQNGFNNLSKLEAELIKKGQRLSSNDCHSLAIYNAVLGLDECDQYGDKASRTNLTKLINRILNRRRHTYTSILMVFIDPQSADQRLIYKNRTHEIECGFNYFTDYPDHCAYRIRDIRPNKTGSSKWMILDPAECVDLWDSHNIPSISHDLDVHLGGKRRKKRKEDLI